MEADPAPARKKDDGVHTIPPALYRARCARVLRANALDADINLRFGVKVRRRVVIAGFDIAGLDDPARHAAAAHCLVMLIGTRNIILHPEDPDRFDGQIVARAYLDMYAICMPHDLAAIPIGMSDMLIDVGLAMCWARDHNFDARTVRTAFREQG